MTVNVTLFTVSCDTPEVEEKPQLGNASNSSEQLMLHKSSHTFHGRLGDPKSCLASGYD